MLSLFITFLYSYCQASIFLQFSPFPRPRLKKLVLPAFQHTLATQTRLARSHHPNARTLSHKRNTSSTFTCRGWRLSTMTKTSQNHSLLSRTTALLHLSWRAYRLRHGLSWLAYRLHHDIKTLPYPQIDHAWSIAHLSHYIFDVSPLLKQQANNEGLTCYYVGIFLFFWSPYWADTDVGNRLWGVMIWQAPIVIWLYALLVHLRLVDTISSISCNSDNL
jgi:hypothetical protein